MKNDGGPAFPERGRHGGMSLRDYARVHFTAAWIQALARRHEVNGYSDEGVIGYAERYGTRQADAMLAEREKETSDG